MNTASKYDFHFLCLSIYVNCTYTLYILLEKIFILDKYIASINEILFNTVYFWSKKTLTCTYQPNSIEPKLQGFK